MTLLLLLLSAASGSELDTPFSRIQQARADVLFDASERYNLVILARALVAGTHRGLRTVDRTSGLPEATLVLTFDDQGDRNALICVPEGARVRATPPHSSSIVACTAGGVCPAMPIVVATAVLPASRPY